MSKDWVLTFTFEVDPSMETMDLWERELAGLEGSVARIPGHGVDVTVFAPGDMAMFEAATKMANEVALIVKAEPIGAQILDEAEWQRRAEAPTIPELMSAAEIADALGVSRQRVHQLRETATFPAPLADLRGGAVWDANAIRKFNEEWERKPGRPRKWVVTVSDPNYLAALRQVSLPDIQASVVNFDVHINDDRLSSHADGTEPDLIAINTEGKIVMAEYKGRANSREVVPNPAGGWDVKKPGADRASAHLRTQEEAVDRARQILKNDGGGELRTHRRNGEIRASDTVKPGNDPYPPKG